MISMLPKTLSLYVHIPFCARKCNYCDFLSFNAEKELMDEYFDALEKEIQDLTAQLEEPNANKGQIYDKISQLQGRISEIKIRQFLEGIPIENTSEENE